MATLLPLPPVNAGLQTPPPGTVLVTFHWTVTSLLQWTVSSLCLAMVVYTTRGAQIKRMLSAPLPLSLNTYLLLSLTQHKYVAFYRKLFSI